LLDRIVEARNQSVISAYEKRIASLERETALIYDRMARSGKPRHTLEETFELALDFLSNLWKIWDKGNLEWQKTILRLTFAEPVAYCRNQGLRTPEVAFPFKALGVFSVNKSKMVHPTGFEPVASAFGAGLRTYPKCTIGYARARYQAVITRLF